MKKPTVTKKDTNLAEHVRKHPALYDKSLKEFKNKQMNALIWKTVAAATNLKTGAAARQNFRNLRKRYTNAKKRFAAVNVSGTSTKAIEKAKAGLDQYSFLGWLDPHIVQRSTKTNMPDSDDDSDTNANVYVEDDEDLDLEDIEDEDDDEEMEGGQEEGEDEGNEGTEQESEFGAFGDESSQNVDFTSSSVEQVHTVTSPQVTISKPNGPLLSVATVTSPTVKVLPNKAPNKKSGVIKEQPKHTRTKMVKTPRVKNWEATRSIEKEELSVLRSLANKIDGNDDVSKVVKKDDDRDECAIFGELVASKMRKLDEQAREQVEMTINNALSEHRLRYLSRKSSRAPLLPQHQQYPSYRIDSPINIDIPNHQPRIHAGAQSPYPGGAYSQAYSPQGYVATQSPGSAYIQSPPSSLHSPAPQSTSNYIEDINLAREVESPLSDATRALLQLPITQ